MRIEFDNVGGYEECLPYVDAAIESLTNDSTILPCLEHLVIIDYQPVFSYRQNEVANMVITGPHQQAVRKLVSERKLRHVTTAGMSEAFRNELAVEFDFFRVCA